MKTWELVLEKGAKDRQTALPLDCLLPVFVGNSLNTFCSSRYVCIHLLSSTGGSTWVCNRFKCRPHGQVGMSTGCSAKDTDICFWAVPTPSSSTLT